MNTVIFTPDRNHKRNDFQGGFAPWSNMYRRYHPDSRMVRMKPGEGLDTILANIDDDTVNLAFFCHGYRSGIQLGLNMQNRREFVHALPNKARILLYACSTGTSWYRRFLTPLNKRDVIGGEGGFADALNDEALRQGKDDVAVFAHYTAGRADINPHVRVWWTAKGPQLGAHYEYGPTRLGKKAWKEWRAWLKRDNNWCRVMEHTLGEP